MTKPTHHFAFFAKSLLSSQISTFQSSAENQQMNVSGRFWLPSTNTKYMCSLMIRGKNGKWHEGSMWVRMDSVVDKMGALLKRNKSLQVYDKGYKCYSMIQSNVNL